MFPDFAHDQRLGNVFLSVIKNHISYINTSICILEADRGTGKISTSERWVYGHKDADRGLLRKRPVVISHILGLEQRTRPLDWLSHILRQPGSHIVIPFERGSPLVIVIV